MRGESIAGGSEIAPGTAFTIGHSTHEVGRLVELLRGAGVRRVADVRRFPRSRRHPQLAAGALAPALAEEGVEHHHLPELGGFRKPAPDSQNRGWRVDGFRGYADHMASEEFARGLARLEELASGAPTAVMCAEAQWQRCHRRLVSDALVARGWEVLHIGADGRREPHALTSFAHVAGGGVTYPPLQATIDE
jgi:uncharacterized protein (DUF488 family)